MEHGVARFGEDGRGKNGFEGFIFRMCALEPKTVMNLVRAMMPTKVTVEHKEEKIESIDDLKQGLESIGLRMEDLRPFKFHTPEQVLELTARDVTDDTNDTNK